MFASIPANSTVFMSDKTVYIDEIVTLTKPVRLVGGTIRSRHLNGALWLRSGDITISGTTIIGNGTAVYNGNVSLIRVNGTDATHFKNIKIIDVSLIDSQGSSLRIEYCDNVEVVRARVEGFVYMGVQLQSVINAKVHQVSVSGNRHEPTIGNSYGISISDTLNTLASRSKHVTVTECYVDGMRSWVGIETHGGYDVRIHNNTVVNCASGIAMVSGASDRITSAERVSVIGNYINYGDATTQRGGLRLQGKSPEITASGILTQNTVIGYTTPSIFTNYNEQISELSGNILT